MVWLRNFQNNYIPQDAGLRGGTTYYIPMKVHIVGTDDGIGYYNHTYLFTSICELNEHYAETGFVFTFMERWIILIILIFMSMIGTMEKI